MNKLAKKLSSVLGSSPSTAARQSRRRVRRNRRRASNRRMARRSNASRVPRGILAGYGSAVTASFYNSRRGDGEIVRGFDLITSPLNISGLDNPNISYFITANPASWNGTRIAAIASGYQNYRPLQFKIHYRPQSGSTSEISMFIGTVWQNTYITDRSSIEPSLVTSPGGTYLPAWQSCCSVVPLGRRLPQRMFPIRDPDFSTVPFSVVCRASGGGPTDLATAMPGRIFIEYVYEFRNAIGSGGGGFQPSTVNSVTLNKGNLYYSGTTAIGPKIYTSNSEGSSTGPNLPSGWIVEMEGPPSVDFPLFARLSTDEVFGSKTSGGTPTGIGLVEINGTAPSVDSTPPSTVLVYRDNGRPT